MEKTKLFEKIQFLEDKIKILERENIETTNSLYEIENRLQAQIDSIVNYSMLNRQVLEEMHGSLQQ